MGRVHANRVVVALGVLLLVVTAFQYYSAIDGIVRPWIWPRPQHYYVERLACACTLSSVLVGLAMVLRSPVIGTYGVVLWLLFPAQAMVHDLLDPRIFWEVALKGPKLPLFAAPLALLAGLVDRRHLLLAVGVSLVVFWAKGMVNHFWGEPEAQIILVEALGQRRFQDLFMTLNWIALGLGVPVSLAGWWLLRRLSRRGAPGGAPPRPASR